MKVLSLLKDIFIEKEKSSSPRFLPHDLSEHYRKELGDIALDQIIVATKYSEIDHALERLKYFSEREYGESLVEVVAKVVEVHGLRDIENTVIVPVPMHWSRYFIRGFDHTFFLVESLSKKTHISPQKLLSTLWSPHQSKLSREKRLENKVNRFRMRNHTHIPETAILFDDVISSGATANECAKVLKGA